MAITYITGTAKASATGVDVTTDPVDATQGGGADFVVIAEGWYGSTNPPTLTDSQSLTWASRTAYGVEQANVRISYATIASPSTAHTISHIGILDYSHISAMWFKGVSTSAYDGTENGASAGGQNSPFASGSITPSQNNCVVIAGITLDGTSTSVGIDGGFTSVSVTGNTADDGGIGYLIQTSAAAANPNWTYNVASNVAAAIAAFRAAAGGGGGTAIRVARRTMLGVG